MSMIKRIGVAVAALLLAAASSAALADRDWHGGGDWHHHGDWDRGGHVHFGLYFGAPLGWNDWDYPPPYYYYPPRVVVVPSSPPVYVQQPSEQPAPEAQQYWWYYCPGSKTYYPYVKQCPGGWQRVAPHPPSP